MDCLQTHLFSVKDRTQSPPQNLSDGQHDKLFTWHEAPHLYCAAQ
ncbi:hypothetical protein [Acinetobacter sp. ME22]|nr:hypothetical protein [Acinetobacter sp. ME22]